MPSIMATTEQLDVAEWAMLRDARRYVGRRTIRAHRPVDTGPARRTPNTQEDEHGQHDQD